MDTGMTGTSIIVNGEQQAVQARTLAALLDEKGIEGGRGIAVAVNGSVVPRSAWPQTAISAGDEIEIVQAKQGG